MAKNVFTDRDRATNLAHEEDYDTTLRSILRDMFPNDPTFRSDGLYTDKTITTTEDGKSVVPITGKTKIKAERNDKKVLSFNSTTKKYGHYKLNKMLPTIDDEDLDSLIDDEWEYFVDTGDLGAPKVNGLFVINKEISNPPDFHHMYLTRGPGMIDDRIMNGEPTEEVIATTFVVFFIVNSVALPIPNYKTLEVMLVDRDLTYSAITEATPEQVKEFDLQIDGRFQQDLDGTYDPYEEFRYRQMLDRSTKWDYQTRFKSGYRPGYTESGRKFYRDPGDYYIPKQIQRDSLANAIKSQESLIGKTQDEREAIVAAKQLENAEKKATLDKPDNRTFDSSPTSKVKGIGDIPPAQTQLDQRYFDLVFQAQTYRERLRERFEGKLMLLQWPTPEYIDEDVQSGTLDTDTVPLISDDKIYYVRMMINGYWKGVIDMTTFRQYALMNNIDISGIDIDRDPEIEGVTPPPEYVTVSLDDEGSFISYDESLISALKDVNGAAFNGYKPSMSELDEQFLDANEGTFFELTSLRGGDGITAGDTKNWSPNSFGNFRAQLVSPEAGRINQIFQGIVPSSFNQIVGGSLAAGFVMDGLYGADGIINQLVQNGGATVIQDDLVIIDDMQEAVRLVQQSILSGDNGVIRADGVYDRKTNELLYSKEEWMMVEKKVINEIKSPGWSDFSHIVEVDRLDSPEYEQYLDYYSNGGKPFDIDYLQPYEPAGSIHYYPKEQLDTLYQQAKDQAAVDSIKKQIMEMLPGLIARATDLDERFKAQPDSYYRYCIQMLGPRSPIYKIMHADNSHFDFYRKRTNRKRRKKKGDKFRGSNASFLRLCEKENKIFRRFTKEEEDAIMFGGGRDWWRSVGKEDHLLDFLRTYEKFVPIKWLYSIDKDGKGFTDAGLVAKTNKIISNVDNKIDNATANLVGSIDNLGDKVSSGAAKIGDALGDAFEDAGSSVSGAGNDITNTDIGLNPDGDPLIDASASTRFDRLNNIINTGLNKTNKLGGRVQNTLGNAADSIGGSISDLGGSISDLGGQIDDAISGEGITAASDRLEAGVDRAGDNLSDSATNLIQGTSEVIGKAMLKEANMKNPVKIGGVTSDFNHHDRKGMVRLDGFDRRARKLLKRYDYTKLCTGAYLVINKLRPEASGMVDAEGNPVSVGDKGKDIDSQFKLYRGQIDSAINAIKDIDARLMAASKLEEFQDIYNDLQDIELDFDNIDLTVFKQGEDLKIAIDDIQKYMANQLYSAIQYVRSHIWNDTRKRFYITWAKDAKDAMEACVPSKVFDNYQPDDI